MGAQSAKVRTVMGTPGSGFGSGHLLSLIFGYLAKQFLSDTVGLERRLQLAVADQIGESGERCAKACASSCGQCDLEPCEKVHSWKFTLSVSLLSISTLGWIFLLIWWWLCRGKSCGASGRGPGGFNQPESLDLRRHRAQLQLSEIRARARTHGNSVTVKSFCNTIVPGPILWHERLVLETYHW